jgi:hypothetical protein
VVQEEVVFPPQTSLSNQSLFRLVKCIFVFIGNAVSTSVLLEDWAAWELFLALVAPDRDFRLEIRTNSLGSTY